MSETSAPSRADADALPRLFILSAILTKHDGATISINNALSFRISSDCQDAVIGRYVQYVMELNPGFALSGKVAVMEITRQELAFMDPDRM